MKQALVGFALVMLVAGAAWIVSFGAAAPCEAMRAEAHKLSELPDTRSKGVGAILDKPADGSVSTVECAALAVRIKAFGAGGVTVVGPGAPRK